MLELVHKVSKHVIRCALTLHPTQLLTLAEEALAGMPGDQEDVRIHLNPEECARIRELAEASGLKPMVGMARYRVLQGETTVDEVRRAIGLE